jgi:hypothetical protein
MNLALGALIIILLLLPALFFRIGVTMLGIFSKPSVPGTLTRETAQKNKQNRQFYVEMVRRNLGHILSKLNFSEIIFVFCFIPLLLHFISLIILRAADQDIDYSLLLNVFASKPNVLEKSGDADFNLKLLSFLKYSIIECVIALALGWLFAELGIRKLDFVSRKFMGENIWFQQFNGLILSRENREKVDLISIEIVCYSKETSVIYSGVLRKFDIRRDTGSLAYVMISDAGRRDLRPGTITTTTIQNTFENNLVKESKQQSSTGYDNKDSELIKIPGKYLTIPGEQVININIRYHQYDWGTDPNAIVPVGLIEI